VNQYCTMGDSEAATQKRPSVTSVGSQGQHAAKKRVKPLVARRQALASFEDNGYELKCLFHKYDVNGDGRLDEKEVRTLLADLNTGTAAGFPPEDEEVRYIFSVADKTADGRIDVDELKIALIAWQTYMGMRTQLQGSIAKYAPDGSGALGAEQVKAWLTEVNHGAEVTEEEAAWVLREAAVLGDKLTAIELIKATALWYSYTGTPDDVGEVVGWSGEAAKLAHQQIGWSSDGVLVDRGRLVERLHLERTMEVTLCRLLNLLVMFFFLVFALTIAAKNDDILQLHKTLEYEFQLGSLGSIMTIPDLRAYLTTVADVSSKFAPLSDHYFGGDADVVLVADQRTFSEPLPFEVAVPVLNAFSLSVWVRIPDLHLARWVIRRPMAITGEGTRTTCWGWRISGQHHGFELVYGGHDHGAEDDVSEVVVVPQSATGGPPEAPFNSTLRAGAMTMLTMVVNGSKASFVMNTGKAAGDGQGATSLVNTVDLPRPLTDCAGSYTMIGDADLTLGELQYFTSALSVDQIGEIYAGGSPLAETGRGIVIKQHQSEESQLMDHAIDVESAGLTAAIEDSGTQKRVSDVIGLAVAQGHSPPVASPRPKLAVGVIGALEAAEPTARAGAAQTVFITSGNTLKNDEVLSTSQSTLQYHDMLEGPYEIVGSSGRHIWKPAPPVWTNNGGTFTTWFQHKKPGFLWSRSMDTADQRFLCWGFMVFEDGLEYWGHKNPGAISGSSTLVQWHFKIRWNFVTPLDYGDTWRHLAVAFQGESSPTEPIKVFLDGVELAIATVDGVPDMHPLPSQLGPGLDLFQDCPVRPDLPTSVMTLGHRVPGNWWWRGNIWHMRYYAVPLPAASVHKLVHEALVPGTTSTFRSVHGCTFISEVQDNGRWKDAFGGGCEWYFEHRTKGKNVCANADARQNCPLSCGARSICHSVDTTPEFKVWDRIMKLGPQEGKEYQVCLPTGGSEADLTKPKVLNDEVVSPLIAAATGFNSEVLSGSLDGPGADYDPYCSFSTEGLDVVEQQYNKAAADGGQEFTMYAWVRGVDDPTANFPHFSFWMMREALTEANASAAYVPWIHTYSGVANRQVDLELFAVGAAEEEGLCVGARRQDSTGAFVSAEVLFESADVQDAVPKMANHGPWNLVALIKRADGTLTSVVNSASASERVPVRVDCLKTLLSAVVIEKEMSIGPITIIPRALSVGEVQHRYQHGRLAMALRRPPTEGDRARTTRTIPRQNQRYTGKLMLLSPPLIMQTMYDAGDCVSSWDNEVVQKMVELGRAERCSGIYNCPDLQGPLAAQRLYACRGDRRTSRYFGLTPEKSTWFSGSGGDAVYSDYLTTIMKHRSLVRDGEELHTESFINTLSEHVNVGVLLHSPALSITTLLSITADLTSAKLEVSYDIQHLLALRDGSEGGWWDRSLLTRYIIFQAIVVIFVLILAVDNAKFVRALWRRRQALKRRGTITFREYLTGAVDQCIILGMLVLLGIMIPLKITNATTQERIIDEILGVEWGNPDVTYDQKKTTYLAALHDLDSAIYFNSSMDTFAMALLLGLVLRILMATAAHPRTALLVETVATGFNDIVHFMCVFVPAFYALAAVATWRYGGDDVNLATLTAAANAQYDAMLGPPGNLGLSGASGEFAAYGLLFWVVVFFFMINFIFAIIVDSYAKVVEKIEEQVTEQDIIRDVIGVLQYQWLQRVHRWPPVTKIIDCIDKLEPELKKIGFAQLKEFHIFRNQQAVSAWLNFYYGYLFLDPQDVPSGKPSVVDYDQVTERAASEGEYCRARLRDMEQRVMSRLALLEASIKS